MEKISDGIMSCEFVCSENNKKFTITLDLSAEKISIIIFDEHKKIGKNLNLCKYESIEFRKKDSETLFGVLKMLVLMIKGKREKEAMKTIEVVCQAILAAPAAELTIYPMVF